MVLVWFDASRLLQVVCNGNIAVAWHAARNESFWGKLCTEKILHFPLKKKKEKITAKLNC